MYPKTKMEAWWVVVGDKKKNLLLAIKRLSLGLRTRTKLEFAAPDEVRRLCLCVALPCCDLMHAESKP